MKERTGPSIYASLLAIACGLTAWWAAAQIHVAGRRLVATPIDTLGAISRSGPALMGDLGATASRVGIGLVAGVATGLVLGAIAAIAARRAPVIEGMLDFARSVPPVVLLPVALLAFGYNEVARIATVAVGCVWTMALAVTTAAACPRSLRREMLDLAGATAPVALAWTQPWESLGVLIVGLRASASAAVIVAVVTEMVAGAEHGMGGRVISAMIAGDTPDLTLDVLAVGTLGYLVNRLLRGLERWARRMET